MKMKLLDLFSCYSYKTNVSGSKTTESVTNTGELIAEFLLWLLSVMEGNNKREQKQNI